MNILCAIGTDTSWLCFCESSGLLSPNISAIADFQNSALCAHRVRENRLSPSMLGDNSPELSHTCRYTISIPLARIIFICYVWIYRATPDFRSPQQTPKTVSRAISKSLAYIYYTRDQDRHYVSIRMPRLIDMGRVSGRRWPPS